MMLQRMSVFCDSPPHGDLLLLYYLHVPYFRFLYEWMEQWSLLIDMLVALKRGKDGGLRKLVLERKQYVSNTSYCEV